MLLICSSDRSGDRSPVLVRACDWRRTSAVRYHLLHASGCVTGMRCTSAEAGSSICRQGRQLPCIQAWSAEVQESVPCGSSVSQDQTTRGSLSSSWIECFKASI